MSARLQLSSRPVPILEIGPFWDSDSGQYLQKAATLDFVSS